ncbi:MAG: histidine kinase [Bacteroidia bacterium]
MPRTIFRNKQRLFILGSILSLVVLALMGTLVDHVIAFSGFSEQDLPFSNRPSEEFRVVFLSLFLGSLVIAVGTSNKLIERWKKEQEKNQEKQKEQLKTQLELLKNQINPHFFFNTLNNIYSLIDLNPAKAQESVQHLSKLMRYHLYKTNSEKVALKNEILFLKDYIELMKIRINEKVKLNIDFKLVNEAVEVPPLLFEPLIENAFKHGVSYTNESFVSIELLQLEKELVLKVENSDHSQNLNKEKGGVGLANIEQRLNLIYGKGNYSFTYGAFESRFRSELKMPIE